MSIIMYVCIPTYTASQRRTQTNESKTNRAERLFEKSLALNIHMCMID